MKYLLVIIVVLVGAWLLVGRRRNEVKPPAPSRPKTKPAAAAQQMVACAHCGVHLPQGDALVDTAQRNYCGEPHRLAGPR